MAIIFYYSLRNLLARRLTTFLTALGMALVVFVFAAIVMLGEGLRQTLVDTGSWDNAFVLRKGSETEVQSTMDRDQAAVIETWPEVAMGQDGGRLLAKELMVLMVLEKRGGGTANVPIRGMDSGPGRTSLALRPVVRVVAGRLPQPGTSEIMVGSSVVKGFAHAGLGGSLHFAQRQWHIVGVFDAGRTAFSSEVWGDADQLMQAFRRQVYSVVVFRMRDPASLGTIRARADVDPRLTVEVEREPDFYRKQSEMLATFLNILGLSLTAIFSIGAVVGAMITMYSAVATRTREIGTLRALGFGRGVILLAFLLESAILGTMGGLLGLAMASCLQSLDVSTTNFQTFSELAFSFQLTPGIAGQAMGFALGMGLLGGILPAIRAARLNLMTALRS